MAPQPSPRRLRIGVDVGGTNTDGVILDPSLASSSPSKGILAHVKTATTPNPSEGIMTAITSMFTQLQATHAADIRPEDAIASVTIGTTHFVNAVIERDPSRLSRVAVLRLSGPFSKHVPPCVDWPDDMRSLMLGYHARVKGGLEVDGSLISDIDESEIVEQCKEIRKRGGIKAVVINGVFSPIDTVYRQEERAAEIVRRELGGQEEVDVVCSKEVANLGFLERENAAVLNASILRFARRTIREFRQAVGRLGLKGVPVFITQNDGTILKGEKAAELPIKTFSSGPTNSMRGAAFLVQGQEKDGKKEGQEQGKAMMVVDVGGTTTDVGLLLPNGFPRQQAAYSELAGVRMNFSCPDIKSIGLGGGSIVRKGKNGITIGPDSVGYRINKEALLFGGSTLTTTDCTVLTNPEITSIGDASLVKAALTEEETQQFKAIVKSKIEKIIDNMKTSPEDLPAILVGGGAVIAPDELQGASKVLKPRWSEVANAIGAAIARVSAVVDTIKSTEAKTEKQFLEEIKKDAVERTIAAGASPESVEVVEVEMLPLQYVENKTRFVVRAAGDFDFTRSYTSSDDNGKASSEEEAVGKDLFEPQTVTDTKPKAATSSQVNVLTYTPNVLNRIWHISETDLTFISTGCYILGTGGGGSPYASMILLRQLLRSGASVRVVSPADVPDSAAVGCGCGAGSPTVSIEKLQGDEMMQAQTELYKALSSSSSDQNQNYKATHMIALEIGGGNGLQGMTLGASSNMDIPCVDGDWMGRAYPTKWQTTPVVFNERSPIWSPIAVADGNGNVLVMPKAASDAAVENIIRAALSQMGSQVGAADPPVTGAEMKRWVVENTVSQAWRLGRAVARARAMNRLDEVAETIVEECGGGQKGAAAKMLFKGKIVGVRRTLRMGHVYGECIIEGTDMTDDTTTTNHGRRTGGRRGGQGVDGEEKEDFIGKRIKIPFKNENIAAIRIPAEDGSNDENKELEKQEDVLAIVPDLISVIDAQSGEAVGTPEYRYGLLVIVIGIAASDKWTGSQRGIDLGGPKAFGFDHLKYEPLGRFVKPVSVIDEFDRSIE
ncbi:hypothetical protein GE21DRAFT_1913 [Neurospora crassa]|uniref:Hydantoinase n=1 Tax=Neurospora crassa (strain ATCC 24698 / 74-OR23-1A / CBS 708.71 / DSM 1257 / FGSC 987) TaxID=367110 RepID=Q7SFT5_NEUCR|nr:hydantoinase [Neurospora crassa OR74A]EAA35716.3 hydantoinase [Neurospora crassa OR74A]KHE83735.1 hypothetical protein GE21DRAFT_1913 [Neurospora crassa]|eukprot:XP_964952.3 hydantoinase [Neurospora crassa OR74A]